MSKSLQNLQFRSDDIFFFNLDNQVDLFNTYGFEGKTNLNKDAWSDFKIGTD